MYNKKYTKNKTYMLNMDNSPYVIDLKVLYVIGIDPEIANKETLKQKNYLG